MTVTQFENFGSFMLIYGVEGTKVVYVLYITRQSDQSWFSLIQYNVIPNICIKFQNPKSSSSWYPRHADRHDEKENTDKTEQAQIKQTYEEH